MRRRFQQPSSNQVSLIATAFKSPSPNPYGGSTSHNFGLPIPRIFFIQSSKLFSGSQSNTDFRMSLGSGAERVTIPVEEVAAVTKEVVDVVTPLTQSAYKGMTPTMQKMSLMGKVVVVTGYGYILHFPLLHFPLLLIPRSII